MVCHNSKLCKARDLKKNLSTRCTGVKSASVTEKTSVTLMWRGPSRMCLYPGPIWISLPRKSEEKKKRSLLLKRTTCSFHVETLTLFCNPRAALDVRDFRLSQNFRRTQNNEYPEFTKMGGSESRPLNLPQKNYQTITTYVSRSNEKSDTKPKHIRCGQPSDV
jgi:hypothetical protein